MKNQKKNKVRPYLPLAISLNFHWFVKYVCSVKKIRLAYSHVCDAKPLIMLFQIKLFVTLSLLYGMSFSVAMQMRNIDHNAFDWPTRENRRF